MCEEASNQKFLKISPETVQFVRQQHGLEDPQRLREAVDMLEQWVQLQNHFTKKDFPRRYLEKTLIATKGSMEQAKAKLDRMCTLRTVIPHFFQYADIRNYFKNTLEYLICCCPLPALDKEHCRPLLVRLVDNSYFRDALYIEAYTYFVAICEYIKMFDYAAGYHFILDYSDVNVLEVAKKINILDLQQCLTFALEACSFRMKGMHIISPSSAVQLLVNVVKPLLGPKLGQRVHTHKSADSLSEFLSQSLLPREYGGDLAPMKEIQAEWLDAMSSEESMAYLLEMRAAQVDAGRRAAELRDGAFGPAGSFRTLGVD